MGTGYAITCKAMYLFKHTRALHGVHSTAWKKYVQCWQYKDNFFFLFILHHVPQSGYIEGAQKHKLARIWFHLQNSSGGWAREVVLQLSVSVLCGYLSTKDEWFWLILRQFFSERILLFIIGLHLTCLNTNKASIKDRPASKSFNSFTKCYWFEWSSEDL